MTPAQSFKAEYDRLRKRSLIMPEQLAKLLCKHGLTHNTATQSITQSK